ncbi:MAG: hypothetical protein AAB402_01970 [Patescibacteria group bacterium]|mgnify:FL=1
MEFHFLRVVVMLCSLAVVIVLWPRRRVYDRTDVEREVLPPGPSAVFRTDRPYRIDRSDPHRQKLEALLRAQLDEHLRHLPAGVEAIPDTVQVDISTQRTVTPEGKKTYHGSIKIRLRERRSNA